MINLKAIKKGYKDPETGDTVTILDVDSLAFADENHYVLSGPSGVGKTTLLHLISGLVLPDYGEISIHGSKINTLSESERDRFRADHIGYIFQSFNLIQGFTALENVQLGMMFAGRKQSKQTAIDMLVQVGLEKRLHYTPSQLSTGQQQRVCIARALVNNPDIILADEPTGNLDPFNSNEIMDLLVKVASSKTLIVVTHEQDVLSRFENTIDISMYHPMFSGA